VVNVLVLVDVEVSVVDVVVFVVEVVKVEVV
jgi:hypothetical protein